jgi:hypothetical protein
MKETFQFIGLLAIAVLAGLIAIIIAKKLGASDFMTGSYFAIVGRAVYDIGIILKKA